MVVVLIHLYVQIIKVKFHRMFVQYILTDIPDAFQHFLNNNC